VPWLLGKHKPVKLFPANRKFALTAFLSPIRTAKAPLEKDLDYRVDGVQPNQWKWMELPSHPVKNESIVATVLNSLLKPCISNFFSV
jgi:hypothetical protein